ncbi:MAG: Nramp family divalent metal transporter [Elusimicrobia bacterium]|nr:Nramp family divalent metal transporter [Elusimicrobiota bacterium]
MRVAGRPVETHPTVPEPLPLRRFMVYVGPVMMTVALGLGTSELILYPRLTAEFGTGWLGLMVLALLFQTVWAQELARWTVVCGEHGAEANSRIMTTAGGAVFISGAMFCAFAIPAWATAAASALHELIRWPASKELGTLVWAYASFLLVFLIVFLSKTARKCIEHIATWATLGTWALLIVTASMAVQPDSVGRMARHLFVWEIPAGMNWWVLGSTLAWVGAGPCLLWHTYWMKDAGWGMATYIGSIPGGMGEPVRIRSEGLFPEPTPENVSRLKTWIGRSNLVLWLAYFVGSLGTILIFVGLSDSILRPQGLIPKGYDVVKHQALFFKAPLGDFGVTLFLAIAWLFFFKSQMAISEAVVRQNTDLTMRLLRRDDVKRVYLGWWGVYLAISFVLIGLQYLVPGASPFAFVTTAAMLSFVSLVVSMGATLVGSIVLYRDLPREVRPGPLTIGALAVGLVFHLYWIVRAVAYHIRP